MAALASMVVLYKVDKLSKLKVHGLLQVRDLYWTFRNFRNRVADFVRYRRVTANMDERFADATPEDLERCEGICIICREDMAPGARNKKLPCNHVFHMHCLRSGPTGSSFCSSDFLLVALLCIPSWVWGQATMSSTCLNFG